MLPSVSTVAAEGAKSLDMLAKAEVIVGALPILMATLLWLRLGAAGRSRYRLFSLLLASFPLSFAILFGTEYLRGRDEVFSYVWLSADALRWVLWMLAVLEAATLTLESYRGFRAFGQKLIRVAMIVAGVSLVLLWTAVPSEWVSTIAKFWRFEGYVVYASLATIAVVFAVAAAYFRLIPSHNTRVVFSVIAVVLVGNVVSGVYWGLDPRLFYVNAGVHFVAFAGGAFAFSPGAESVPENRPSTASGVRAVAQLEVMNETLLRILKR